MVSYSMSSGDDKPYIKWGESKMEFAAYLRRCRETIGLTQEELVSELYSFDTQHFGGLETVTLSRWERGSTTPHLARQVSILKYFQQQTHIALPCLDRFSHDAVEQMICETGMHNLLGKSKKLILDFPSKMIGADELLVKQLRESSALDIIIDIHMAIDKGFHHKFKEIPAKQIRAWALHPSNTFLVCHYKKQFFGLHFTLRLKPEIFEKIMSREMTEKELTLDDFASFEEAGSNYIISFFAMNDKAATLLFIRSYAHLIANQKVIEEIGTSVIMEDAVKLLKNMKLTLYKELPYDETHTLKMYREKIDAFLASEYVLKMILSEKNCPER